MAQFELETTGGNSLESITRGEIDMQIETAKRYPREIRRAIVEASQVVSADPDTAEECHWSIPRDGKNLEGPSVRLAEILASSWGNLRVQTRTREIGQRDVVVEAMCHDLQSNVAISTEVRRRIVGKNGQRYNDDMITITAAAAQSIALRNAILRIIPKAVWLPVYKAAQETILGGREPIGTRRQRAITWFQARGITQDQLLRKLGLKAVGDIDVAALKTLTGFRNAVQEEDTTLEDLFGSPEGTTATAAAPAPAPAQVPAPSALDRIQQYEPGPAVAKRRGRPPKVPVSAATVQPEIDPRDDPFAQGPSSIPEPGSEG